VDTKDMVVESEAGYANLCSVQKWCKCP